MNSSQTRTWDGSLEEENKWNDASLKPTHQAGFVGEGGVPGFCITWVG